MVPFLTDTDIAYRAETAMASIVREELARPDDARSLLRDLFESEADLVPDVEQGVLGVQVHPMSNPRSNRAIAHLLEHLNAGEFTYPGTNLRLVYSIAGEAKTTNLAPHQNRADQEVCGYGALTPPGLRKRFTRITCQCSRIPSRQSQGDQICNPLYHHGLQLIQRYPA